MSKFDDFKKGLKKVFQQDPEAKKNFKGTAAVTGAFAGASAAFAASKGKPVAALIGGVVGGIAGYTGAGKVLADIDADSVPSPDPFAGPKRKRAEKNEQKTETAETPAPEAAAPEAPAAETPAAPKEEKAAKPASPRRKRGGPKPD